MCLDCSEFKTCPKCGCVGTNEHEYASGRRWQCCGKPVKDEVPLKLDPPKVEAPVVRAPKRNVRSRKNGD